MGYGVAEWNDIVEVRLGQGRFETLQEVFSEIKAIQGEKIIAAVVWVDIEGSPLPIDITDALLEASSYAQVQPILAQAGLLRASGSEHSSSTSALTAPRGERPHTSPPTGEASSGSPLNPVLLLKPDPGRPSKASSLLLLFSCGLVILGLVMVASGFLGEHTSTMKLWLLGIGGTASLIGSVAISSVGGRITAHEEAKKSVSALRSEQFRVHLKQYFPNFIVDKEIMVDNGRYRLALDNRHSTLCVAQDGHPVRVYACNQILSCELLSNQHSETRTDRGAQIGATLVGAALLGGAGAVIGGLSAPQLSQERIWKLELQIVVDDIVAPQIRLPFFELPPEKALADTDPSYLASRQQAEEWLAALCVLISRRAQGQSPAQA